MESGVALQVGVKILLCGDNKKYLLLHRSSKKYPEVQGRWDIVGGRINPGETLIQNLRREIKEETGLELTGEPKLVAAQDILYDPGHHVVRLTYMGRATGEVTLDTEENDAYKWYEWRELIKLDDVDIYFKKLLKDESLQKNFTEHLSK